MDKIFHNKVILVTGACGTIGREVIKQLYEFKPAEIRALDNNESELFMLNEYYYKNSNFNFQLGDVRDFEKMRSVTFGADIILHCAALKHVFFYEYQPFEAVQTNIMGVKNIVEAALKNNLELLIFTSSDKAVNPTNVMGTSKLMGERLITAANVLNGPVNKNGEAKQRFSSVRFGNVLGSRGSVISVFQEQIKNGGPVTVTDKGMTRFVMTISRAAQLVLQGAMLACGGEVLVTKMEAIAIIDLAKAMIDLLAPYYQHEPSSIKIKYIGAKPGEKLYEELMSQEEVSRSLEIEDMFVVLPAPKNVYVSIKYRYPGEARPVTHPYVSEAEPLLSQDVIKDFLIRHHLLPEGLKLTIPATRLRACAS
jgi:FlaA1/EpsC-like NDP-sugar epimerase